jgi:hypothetical protein
LEDADGILLAQDSVLWRALVNTIMNLQAEYKAGSSLTITVVITFCRRILIHGVA